MSADNSKSKCLIDIADVNDSIENENPRCHDAY
jgi:hypothetical protein